MEEEMEGFVAEFDAEPAEIDEDYEFDASRFFDFMTPELDSEIEEVERWFEISGNYAPSPFIVKLDLDKIIPVEVVSKSPKAKSSRHNTKSINSSSDGVKHAVLTSKKNEKGKCFLKCQDSTKAKTKTDVKFFQPRSSTLLKPTASHLAKQCSKVHDSHSGHICTRAQKVTTKVDNNLATKRQKLDFGYLKKVAHLKHQFFSLHKSSKKVTVPREPELETLLRAQRRSSKNSSASSETEKQKEKGCNVFKASPLSKKAPSWLQPKKSAPRSPECQVFHFKTRERANRHASAKVFPSGAADGDVTQDANLKSTTSTECRRWSKGDKTSKIPPIEQFTKLSLESDIKSNTSSLFDKHASAKRCDAKPNQCGGHMRRREAKTWFNMCGMLRQTSARCRFFLSATPFCCGVLRQKVRHPLRL